MLSTSSGKVEQDILKNEFTIYPVVVISKDTSSIPNSAYDTAHLKISTQDETIRGNPLGSASDTNDRYYDFDLKVGSIKESIDMDNRAYKISSVPITLSNYKRKFATYFQGENMNENGLHRLSDTIYNYYNCEVKIFYKTQSCNQFDDMLLVYSGIVRSINHSEKVINLVAEDRTDYLIHKDVPIASLGYGESVYSKDYLGKPIPITYGDVAQAPAVPYVYREGASSYSTLSIISDDVSHVTGSQRPISIYGYGTNESFPENTYFQSITVDADTDFDINPLYIYKGDYFRVLQNYNSTANTSTNNLINFPEPRQYTIEETGQNLSIFKDFAASYPQNPPAANELQAIKVRYPNQCMLLKSANILNGDEGSNTTGIINLEVPQGILNPQAAIDNAFFGNGHFSSVREFDTFAEVPNSLRLLPEDTTFQVHEFQPYTPDTNGWIHPTESDAGDLETTGHSNNGWGGVLNQVNYLPLMYNWCNTYMHKLPAVYMQLPPADLIKEHVDEFLKGNFGSNNSQEIGDLAIIYNTGSEPIYDTVRHAEFRPQFNISPHFCDAYEFRTNSNGYSYIYGSSSWGRPSGENYFESSNQFDSVETGGNNYRDDWYSGTNSNTYANTGVETRNYRYNCRRDVRLGQNIDSEGFNDYWRYKETAYKPLSGRNSGGVQHYFPTNVYKFSQDYNHSNNPQQITNVYVGLWIDETMYDSMLNRDSDVSQMTPVGENALFINLWDLGDGKPFLYKSKNQFCTLNPNHLTHKEKVGHNIQCKFNSDWNGIKINHYMTNSIIDENGVEIAPSVETAFPSTYSAECMGEWYYSAPNWGLNNAACDYIYMKELVGNNISDSNQNMFGGKSWFIYFEEEEPNGVKNLSDSAGEIGESKGEWNDSGANTRVPKHCLIPCNIKNYNGQYQGHNFNLDYIIDENRADINLSVGQGGTFEERLSILLPMGDLTAEDSFNVDTFVYGKVNLNIPLTDSTTPHNVSNDDNLKLICAATETVKIDVVYFNA